MPHTSQPRLDVQRGTARRSAILDAAARLFARNGVEATTVREIAREVGVLSGSLYHHFPSKDAIAEEIVRGYLDDLLRSYREVLAGPSHPRDALRGLVAASLRAEQRHPHATEVYRSELRRRGERAATDESGIDLTAAATEVEQAWMQVLTRGRALRVFRTDVPVWLVYRLIRDSLFHSRPSDGARSVEDLHEAAEVMTSLVLDGVTPRPAPARTAAFTVPRAV
jgi:AcrR family transcriptional regulator